MNAKLKKFCKNEIRQFDLKIQKLEKELVFLEKFSTHKIDGHYILNEQNHKSAEKLIDEMQHIKCDINYYKSKKDLLLDHQAYSDKQFILSW